MATLTTNISNVSLTVSGNTQKSATISWTCPSVPSGATITSCTLTGKATASMSKGSATITVNGTTVSSGSNFTINLGTSNSTSSVTATAKGGNKNAAGTVTFSNLVYTVNYTEPVVTYTVKFVDWDGTVLKTETVESGKSATAPSKPSRAGYAFTGWDKVYTNITSNLTVTAQYEVLYTVTFIDYDGTVLKTEEVRYGGSATAPEVSRVGYEFAGWSVDFSSVTSNITTMALYTRVSTLATKENGIWINIPKIYKKISGNWVEQINDNWNNLFNSNIRYMKKEILARTAILYSDGHFVFSNNNVVDASHGNVIATYTGWDTEIYDYYSSVPWFSNHLKINTVYINDICPKNTSYWFYDCIRLVSFICNNIDTSNVTSMENMFCSCSKLTNIDLSSFNTSNVTNMSGMFQACSSLTNIDLSSFNTSNVTGFGYMFSGCSKLTNIDLSSFNTSNVTDFVRMFNNCSDLISVNLSSFDFKNISSTNYMFSGCTNPNLTIYVKDEATKTKIESSADFPTTATVVIGSPN